MMEIEQAIKSEIGFGNEPRCKNCANHRTREEDENAPIEFRCHYAGNISFEVDEEDSCQKWEEIKLQTAIVKASLCSVVSA